jgi:hypothetical protein
MGLGDRATDEVVAEERKDEMPVGARECGGMLVGASVLMFWADGADPPVDAARG